MGRIGRQTLNVDFKPLQLPVDRQFILLSALDLEQRMHARLAFRLQCLDQQIERQVGVSLRFQHTVAHSGE